MKTGLIYRLIVNDKSYIGQTTNFNRRFKEHLRASDNKSNTQYLYNAIRYYGKEKVHYEILEDNIILASSIELKDNYLNLAEMKWIKHFDSLNNGYNMTKGGNFGFCPIPWNKDKKLPPLSGKHRKLLSQISKNVSKSETHCKNISLGQFKRYSDKNERLKVSKGMKNYWSTISEDEKIERIKNISKSLKEFHKNVTLEQKIKHSEDRKGWMENKDDSFKEFHKQKSYEGSMKRWGLSIIKLFDSDENIVIEFKGSQSEFKRQHINLPITSLFKNKGIRIFEKLDAGNKKKLEKKGLYPKYKGYKLEVTKTLV